jgi:hypothetical protein
MGYILTMQNFNGERLTVDLDTDDIDYVLKQVKEFMNNYNIVKIKKCPCVDLACAIASALERKC